MKKEPLKISFSSQKGGVGKSAITVLTAAMLHYKMGYQVVIFDCDFPQLSIAKQRERELKAIMENDHFKRMAHTQFSSLNKKAYPIISCNADTALQEAKQFLDNSAIHYDFAFFDFTGTVNSTGILQTLLGMDAIFSPMTADRLVMESTLSFSQVMAQIFASKPDKKGLHLFWNMVDGREKSTLYDTYEKVINELELHKMQHYFSDSKRFRKELPEIGNGLVFRSTLFPPHNRLIKSSRLDAFINEFLHLLNQ
ncbi:ParA family protein [Tenacibaculum jejuense]|uniref:Conjugative transposon protein TraA n=1 Tax=Tenacibaculum jejuense TaxID=584609 RepID=A0A238U5F3_9FLAO|nr:ParA family protein [Tenacibaculum jejuense]SNR14441.1 Conjugative transposon protein TraA [Tenacibaculum jejuense]